MKIQTMKYTVLFLLQILIIACGQRVEQFSKSEPFAIELARVRSFYQAQKIESRLQESGLPGYTIRVRDEIDESNQWYVLLTGAEKDTVAISQLKTRLQIEHQLSEAKILNYNHIQHFLVERDPDEVTEIEKIQAERPDIPDNIYQLIEKFPKNNLFNVKNIALHNFPDEQIPASQLRGFYDAKLDLPRGIKKRLVANKASAFAEVIYQDNLYGDQVTIEVMKMRDDHGLDQMPRARLTSNKEPQLPVVADNLSWYFASLVLNTGRYHTEIYELIRVSSFIELYGYKVVIEPKKGYFRTYILLCDEAGKFVIFSQSTEKTDDEILAYLEDFGKSKGLLEYSEFHNTFFTIPPCLEPGDIFLGYSSSVLGQGYAWSKGNANWAKAMVGHSESSAHFYNSNLKKAWSCQAFDLLTPGKKDFIYNDMYRSHQARGKEPLKVGNSDGFFVKEYGLRYNEVNFPTPGRHIFALGGFSMLKEDLLARALKFQTGETAFGGNPCDPIIPEEPEEPESKEIVKTFKTFHPAFLPIEGAGIHGSFNLNGTVRAYPYENGWKVGIGGVGRTAAVKLGKVLFTGKVHLKKNGIVIATKNLIQGDTVVMNVGSVDLGTATFQVENIDGVTLELESGYSIKVPGGGVATPLPPTATVTIDLQQDAI